MNWQDVNHLFAWDGSWRDVHVDIDTALWQRFLDALQTSRYEIRYSVDGEQRPIPQCMANAFALREQSVVRLAINADGLLINCHFFTTDQIELDPREINSDDTFCALTTFLAYIGQRLQRRVMLTPEGREEEILIGYDPDGDYWHYAHRLKEVE